MTTTTTKHGNLKIETRIITYRFGSKRTQYKVTTTYRFENRFGWALKSQKSIKIK